MKKLTLSLLLISTLTANAQTSPFIIEHCIDKMTDKEYHFTQNSLVCSDVKNTQGFIITPSFKKNYNELTPNSIICKSLNIGNCNEKDILIIMFDDDTKITYIAWNKFNCEGNSYFTVSKEDVIILSTKKIKAMRYINERSYESLTYILKEKERNYFINAYTNQKIIEVDCSN
jgi:hypothetical protein